MQLREGGVGRPNDSQTGAVVEVRTQNTDIPGGDRDPITAVASRSRVQGWSTLDLDAGSTIHPYFHELLPDQRDSFTGEVGNDWRSEKRSWWAIYAGVTVRATPSVSVDGVIVKRFVRQQFLRLAKRRSFRQRNLALSSCAGDDLRPEPIAQLEVENISSRGCPGMP